jgi:hypothetical protein
MFLLYLLIMFFLSGQGDLANILTFFSILGKLPVETVSAAREDPSDSDDTVQESVESGSSEEEEEEEAGAAAPKPG